MSHASGRSKMGHVHIKKQLPKPKSGSASCNEPAQKAPEPQEAPAGVSMPVLQEVAPHEPMTARQVGFNGEVNIFTPCRFSDLPHQRLSIRFLKGKTEHLSRAQEAPNHFFWNRETETFYYINPEKRLFRVQFFEEGAK